jgi:hypothetical protein
VTVCDGSNWQEGEFVETIMRMVTTSGVVGVLSTSEEVLRTSVHNAAVPRGVHKMVKVK